jgi:hypothetical protein
MVKKLNSEERFLLSVGGICREGNICCKRENVGRGIYAERGNM